MTEKTKASTVTLPGWTMDKLKDISAQRKRDKNLAWSHVNIVAELVNKLHRKEVDNENQ